MLKRYALYAALLTSTTVMLTGCDSALSGMSDSDLRDKHWACQSHSSPSPGKALSCGNFAEECARRKKKKGHTVC
ncbi:MAG: hypothetical protein JKY67_12940 [Pseudomonadales bacterium]|nr:hypothetical protein [Pseudomonadales bacterium]